MGGSCPAATSPAGTHKPRAEVREVIFGRVASPSGPGEHPRVGGEASLPAAHLSNSSLKACALARLPGLGGSPQLQWYPPLNLTSNQNLGVANRSYRAQEAASLWPPCKFQAIAVPLFPTRWLPSSLGAQVQSDTVPAGRSFAFLSSCLPASALSTRSGVNDSLKTLLKQP